MGIHVGVNTEKDVTSERVTGPELALQLPFFDTGKASIARLESEHRRAQRQLEALAVNARSEVREQRDRMLAARDLALYYRQVLLPQRQRILALTLQLLRRSDDLEVRHHPGVLVLEVVAVDSMQLLAHLGGPSWETPRPL